MTTHAPQVVDRAAMIDSAARQLVSVRHRDGSSFITLPLFYPSGTAATVEVSGAGANYFVSDLGIAYRETEQFGAEHLFSRNASAVAESFGVDTNRRVIHASASAEQLMAAIADVAAASVQIACRIAERVAVRAEADIEAELYRRLVHVFGAPKVERDIELVGASSHKWKLSALVRSDGKDIAFEAVSNHHSSIYSAATMFHDLALLERRPVPVAVVRDKSELGAYLGILSQAANVVQDNVPDNTFAQLAAA